MSFEINERLKQQIQEYCDINELELDKYISDSLSRCLYIDKYGDLNQLVNGNKPEDTKNILKEQYKKIILNTEKKEVSLFDGSNEYIIKVDEYNVVPEIKPIIIKEEIPIVSVKENDKKEDVKKENNNKPTGRTRRQIQSK